MEMIIGMEIEGMISGYKFIPGRWKPVEEAY